MYFSEHTSNQSNFNDNDYDSVFQAEIVVIALQMLLKALDQGGLFETLCIIFIYLFIAFTTEIWSPQARPGIGYMQSMQRG